MDPARRLVTLTLLAVVACSSSGFAAGTIETVQFASVALGEDRWVQAYLPDGYDPGGSIDYPAIYFLHGANGNHLGYQELFPHLDNLIATGQIRPVIVIKPDGSGCPWPPNWEGCGWVDSGLQGDYESFLTEDVIAFAEDAYHIIQDSQARGIMGHSMGAFGSMHAALKYPDRYAAVAALSGYPHFGELFNQHVPEILGEQPGPPYEYTPDGLFTGAWFMFSGGFSPNLGNPPYSVDFPLDADGVVIPEVWDEWLLHDPATIALSLTPETAPEIYFDCGTVDPFLLSPVNDAFDAHLTSLAIPHEYEVWTGGHWSSARLPIALRFLDAAFDIVDVGDPEADITPHIVSLDVPNPVLGSAEIRFETASSGPVLLQVFDVVGRLTATVVDHDMVAGTHRVAWNSDRIPAGVYFWRLSAVGDQETRTVVIR